MTRRARRGFTMVEMMVVLIVLSVLCALAVLRYIDLTREGQSSQVAGDISVVRLAALNFYAEKETWPAASGAGVVPPELAPYLPASFSFVRPRWTIAWNGSDDTAEIIITSDDPVMLAKLRARMGNDAPFFQFGTYMMYVLAAPGAPI